MVLKHSRSTCSGVECHYFDWDWSNKVTLAPEALKSIASTLKLTLHKIVYFQVDWYMIGIYVETRKGKKRILYNLTYIWHNQDQVKVGWLRFL